MVGEQEQVGVDLGRVAQTDGAEVAQPFRHASGEERGPPAEQPNEPDHGRVRTAEHQRGEDEPDPEEGHGTMLSLRRVDRDIHRIASRGADEPRKGAADQKQECADMHPVAHPRRQEVVQCRRHAPRAEHGNPGDDDGQDREHAPQREPDQVWDREQESEEDGEPRALDVVGELESDRVRRQFRERQHPVGVARRILVGDEQQVAERLCHVPDAVGGQVSEAAGRAATHDRRKPREERRCRSDSSDARPGRPIRAGVPGSEPRHIPECRPATEDGGEDECGERQHDAGCDPAARLAR